MKTEPDAQASLGVRLRFFALQYCDIFASAEWKIPLHFMVNKRCNHNPDNTCDIKLDGKSESKNKYPCIQL